MSFYQEIEDCLTEGQCQICGATSTNNCPLDERLFDFLIESNFDPYLLNKYHSVKTKYDDYINENDYGSCIFLSEVKRS